ncbi:unnamed protein product [Toxocara canis]|uniref:ABC transmembrane type-2 domain-containing protein n=1 Tax=Toxocara canis TaxID=6265 RepID=A0A3P7GUC5_TOXCA|nr:unnamed protein product [Toxocara canis]
MKRRLADGALGGFVDNICFGSCVEAEFYGHPVDTERLADEVRQLVDRANLNGMNVVSLWLPALGLEMTSSSTFPALVADVRAVLVPVELSIPETWGRWSWLGSLLSLIWSLLAPLL